MKKVSIFASLIIFILFQSSSTQAQELWELQWVKYQIKYDSDGFSSIWALDISPDGSKVLTGSGNRSLMLSDIQNGNEIWVKKAMGGVVMAACFSPDGKKSQRAAVADLLRRL